MDDTPMFPLGAVLFPFAPLPLRIFEERYRTMLRDLLDDEDPTFGVVLIAEGIEVGGADARHRIGTLARIVRVTIGDDEARIVALGQRRIEVVQWLPDAPYPRARTRLLPALEWDPALEPLRDRAEHAVRRALAVATEFGASAWTSAAELADDPLAASWQLAAIAPLSTDAQLELLGSRTLADLLTLLIERSSAAEADVRGQAGSDPLDDEIRRLLDDDAG